MYSCEGCEVQQQQSRHAQDGGTCVILGRISLHSIAPFSNSNSPIQQTVQQRETRPQTRTFDAFVFLELIYCTSGLRKKPSQAQVDLEAQFALRHRYDHKWGNSSGQTLQPNLFPGSVPKNPNNPESYSWSINTLVGLIGHIGVHHCGKVNIADIPRVADRLYYKLYWH